MLSNLYSHLKTEAKRLGGLLMRARRSGSITAHPNPIESADLSYVGATTLFWTSEGTQTVEVHMGAPGGPLFSRSGACGSGSTGNCVHDGTVFYLQDASRGQPPSAADTLGAVTVNLTYAEHLGVHMADSLNRDAIAAVIQRQLGHQPQLGPLRVRPSMTLVCDAYLPNSTVVFKAALDEAELTLDLEGWANERVRRLGVPSPRVMAVDSSRRIFPNPYLIMEKVRGCPLSQLQLAPEKLRPLLRQVGQYIRLVHSVPLEGFGSLDKEYYLSEGGIRGEYETWRDAILVHLEGAAYLEQHGLIDRQTVASVRALLERYDDLLHNCEVGYLLHGDLGLGNVFADPQMEKVTGIIDFSEQQSGDPAWDLSRFVTHLVADKLDYLLEGYESDGVMRQTLAVKMPFYRPLHVIWDAWWAHQCGLIKEMPDSWKSYLDEALRPRRGQG